MGKDRPKLYIRFPHKIKEELEVKNLCSIIESVHLARQKSARWCIVDFKTVDQREKAQEILKKIVIEGKHLIIKAVQSRTKRLSSKKSDSIDTVQELLNN